MDISRSDTSEDDTCSNTPALSNISPLQFYHSPIFKEISGRAIETEYSQPVATLDDLYTIQISHIPFLNANSFLKHLQDVWSIRDLGAKIDLETYNKLFKFWEVSLQRDKSSINLNKSLEDFFDYAPLEAHESLHENIAFYDEPLHHKIRPDPNKAYCSYALFNKLSDDEQIKLAVEETRVISIERRITFHQSYFRLITLMTKGWFNRHMVINGDKILEYSKKPLFF